MGSSDASQVVDMAIHALDDYVYAFRRSALTSPPHLGL